MVENQRPIELATKARDGPILSTSGKILEDWGS
jgi:hypothetical protein